MSERVFEVAEGDGDQDVYDDDHRQHRQVESIDGVQHDTDFYLERADEWRDAEIDRQMGRG